MQLIVPVGLFVPANLPVSSRSPVCECNSRTVASFRTRQVPGATGRWYSCAGSVRLVPEDLPGLFNRRMALLL